MKRLGTILLASCFLSLLACKGETQVKKVVMTTLSGKQINFSNLDEHWVVLNYWANWCAPCKKEIPELNAFQSRHDNVYLVGVNYDGVDENALKDIILKNHIRYFNVTRDPSGDLGLGEIPGIPTTFIFNQDGVLVKRLYGPQTQQSLERAMGFEE